MFRRERGGTPGRGRPEPVAGAGAGAVGALKVSSSWVSAAETSFVVMGAACHRGVDIRGPPFKGSDKSMTNGHGARDKKAA